MKRFILVMALALACLPGANAARAQTAAPLSPSQKTALRYPQPVRVGDLIGRRVLAPSEAQPVLGHVVAIRKAPDGSLQMIMSQSRWLFFSGALVAVPLDSVALLGEHVALPDFVEGQQDAFTPVTDTTTGSLGADEVIRMGLAKPFH